MVNDKYTAIIKQDLCPVCNNQLVWIKRKSKETYLYFQCIGCGKGFHKMKD